ncbi:hypothetical protein WN944_004587 [Citrus x changshan-huyou]|uniref:Fatty acyl-CoA reductase n=1 Tax=Citrus x changshan-huyou TaxID=2935761 RepID=A0AAP0M1R0_9ROSI
MSKNSSQCSMQYGIDIEKFLVGKSFFVTGATGFLAKVLIEKILRTVPEVGKIFLLIKAESEEAASERLKNEVINAELFKCIQQTYGECYHDFMLNKLVPVIGNISESNLGLEGDLATVIANEVDVIINSAASITFHERYDIAIQINTRGPAHIMTFAKKCKKVKGKKTWMARHIYFHKGYGEMLIDTMKENIPIVVIRPGIIESTYKEPFPGWIEGNRMLDLIISYYGKGQLNGFVGDPSGIIDLVPVDMVVNAMLAAIAKHGQAIIQKPEIKVYQIASSVTNPLVIKYFTSLLHEHFDSSPFLDSKGSPIRVPLVKLFTSREDFSAHFLEGAMQRSIIGSSTGELLVQNQYEILRRKEFANIYHPYGIYVGRFDSSNTLGLMQIMNEEEKKKFGFDMGSIDWKHYITNVHVPGLRRHVMKERRRETRVGAENKIPGGPKFYKSKL